MYRNPKWSSPNNGSIDVEILQKNGEWWPFTASLNDPEQHGRELFAILAAGHAGEVAEFDGIGWDEPSDAVDEISATPPSGEIPAKIL